MAGCRSVLAIAVHRGAGVFPPTARTRGALRPPVPGATASRSGSATVAPGVGRAPGGASRAAPAVPGYRSALAIRSEEHTSELQSQSNLVCRLLLEKKKKPYTSLVYRG